MFTLSAGPLSPSLYATRVIGVFALRRQQQRVVPGPGQQVAVLLDVVAEVRVGAHAAEHADPAGVRRGVVARVLDTRPGDLEEDAMLGIGELGLAPAHPEEGGIELVDAVHDRPRVHEARLATGRRRRP